MRRFGMILVGAVAAALVAVSAAAQDVNLLAVGEGTVPVVEPACYGGVASGEHA